MQGYLHSDEVVSFEVFPHGEGIGWLCFEDCLHIFMHSHSGHAIPTTPSQSSFCFKCLLIKNLWNIKNTLDHIKF